MMLSASAPVIPGSVIKASLLAVFKSNSWGEELFLRAGMSADDELATGEASCGSRACVCLRGCACFSGWTIEAALSSTCVAGLPGSNSAGSLAVSAPAAFSVTSTGGLPPDRERGRRVAQPSPGRASCEILAFSRRRCRSR